MLEGWKSAREAEGLSELQGLRNLTEGCLQEMIRHGTTTLFAALDVLTGKVIGRCFARHLPDEFLHFLRTIDMAMPRKLQVHLIVDNYSTHTDPNVKAWLAKHPRFHLPFTRPARPG